MENLFFTSDTHFNHANIIRYCNRPFPSVPAMDEAMIERWNARVGDDDVVYHLGDVTLSGRATASRVFARLRGRIKVLGYPWHHDRGWVPRAIGPSPFTSASGHVVEIVPPLLTISPEVGGRRQPIALCHFPMGEWDRRHHGLWHLHGHSHGNYMGAGAMLDVGVDDHDYAPVALADLPAMMAPCNTARRPCRRSSTSSSAPA